ncbi:MAG TPA: TIGR00645 family protein [Chromatiaceae bacterium]|nr:TIGR00645 family protein [Chromatiaceae bacterium]
MKALEHFLEAFMFNSRWLLAPFYVGLILAIGLLMIVFFKEFLHLIPIAVYEPPGPKMVLGVLSLIDLVLVANLMLIIVFAGYENFVSRIDVAEHEDRPEWMGKVGFTDLKIKLIGSIVAISGIELLKLFVNVSESMSQQELIWKVAIHITLVVSGVLFALMDRIGGNTPH